ncbi:hypothetical protein OC835_002110 [Tilletia horrida]|uniref:REJ domain-containing protein n=1 Tax=Tilletia horrida TaxID=155126 RepID=A0AAN6GB05_9BASI|nr:hypothetical protein OC842_003842 [Tilletia horrida]KAK0536212.1 hypothetical protein OC835_002110 [Tilletia horrida]KAK0557409.1 hypothetical protein OC844_005577 [Tilletia horrida]
MTLSLLALLFLVAASVLPGAHAAEPIIATTPSSSAAAAPATSSAPAASSAAPAPASGSASAAPASSSGAANSTAAAVAPTRSFSTSGTVTFTFNITPSAVITSSFTPTNLPTASPITAGPLAGTQQAPVPSGSAFGPDDSYVTNAAFSTVPSGAAGGMLGLVAATALALALGSSANLLV